MLKSKEQEVMVEQEVTKLGSKSGTLHFITLLGLASKESRRKVGENYLPCPTTVGVRLQTDETILVPVIDVRKNKDTGITSEDIKVRTIQAGEVFDLNMYELMFLVTKEEYGGFISRNGNPQGVYFAPKMHKFNTGEAKLPTPALNFKSGTGSIKAEMLVIDEKVDNKWGIKSEFAEQFGGLFEKKEKVKKVAVPTPTVVALALRQMLEEKVGFAQ